MFLQLNSSLETYLGQLRTFVNNQIGTFTGQIDTEKLDWITQVRWELQSTTYM